MSFGYIGAKPTNKNSSNTGLFNIKEYDELYANKQWSGGGIPVDFLVVGAGGGAGQGHQTGGGGGSGGVRSSVANKGGDNTGANLDSKYVLYYGQSYEVTIGASSGSERTNSGWSQIGKILAIGGGGGEGANGGGGAGGAGGGRRGNNWGRSLNNHYVFPDLIQYQGPDEEVDYDGEFWLQGYSNNAGYGGGAGSGNASYGNAGGAATTTTIASAADAATLGIGQQSGGIVYIASGGSIGAANYGSNSNNITYTGATIGGGGASSQSGVANTGGGGGSGYVSGGGGSGLVVLRYDASYPDITTIGPALVYTGPTTLSGYKYYKFTSGNDNITI